VAAIVSSRSFVSVRIYVVLYVTELQAEFW
jgi:hypothetical protein